MEQPRGCPRWGWWALVLTSSVQALEVLQLQQPRAKGLSPLIMDLGALRHLCSRIRKKVLKPSGLCSLPVLTGKSAVPKGEGKHRVGAAGAQPRGQHPARAGSHGQEQTPTQPLIVKLPSDHTRGDLDLCFGHQDLCPCCTPSPHCFHAQVSLCTAFWLFGFCKTSPSLRSNARQGLEGA